MLGNINGGGVVVFFLVFKSLSCDNKNVDFYFLKWYREEFKGNESKI